ncbi:type I-C CRISPR-associated protein Cas7/Csd2 [Bisgaard Taxon 10/6]|uniref:type I-C CRISPR-associated protein Cas7/Csd2 n=1 Tax=Exercitatus varius TaxID=67857 RepID=UPI0018A5A3A7|nr:type I-C CRISPR-associated protein Cas7/Csd2 [Exercitatus varius]MDG2915804.1 type I-C CRISPR-associated protein Cas7/Csd2 [Exercitatus varius]MDG2957712.1 type I-C CRISPR-associated protein Cas7/Csd2 [Exercitatus varius]QOF68719.1 type I-C CRISPR-associated protein Cas7/Csd2 [Actinobacillus sp. GY-402]
MSLTKKIDFALILKVTNANPNGDPLNGNRPRADFQGFGEMTDVCLKRKIRDRLQDSGESIFVQSDEKKTDGMTSLANRAKDKEVGLGADAFGKKANKDETAKKACEKWLDVRSFGQVFAFGKSDEGAGVSIAVRGPVTIQSAFSVEPVNITSTQITKSVSGEGDGSKRGSDTMGMKHRVDSGIYVAFGAMSPQLAERTGFSDDDAEKIKAVLTKLFEGDASSARPEGSMQVLKLIWWEHNCKAGQYSSAKVHDQLRNLIEENRENLTAEKLHGLITEEVLSLSKENGVLKPEIIDGF